MGAASFVVLGAGLRKEPLLDARRPSLELLAAFDGDNLVGRTGPPASPRRFRSTSRCQERPGCWTRASCVPLGGSTFRPAPIAWRPTGAWSSRLPRHEWISSLGGSPSAASTCEAAVGTSAAEVTLPVGARRVQGWAAGLDGRLSLAHLRLVPIAVVPRRERAALPWMRAPTPDRYRIGRGPVKSTAVDRSEPDGSGFRVAGSEGAFVVDAPAGTDVLVRLHRPTPAPGDAVVWDGDRIALDARRELGVVLPAARGSRLGARVVVPVRVRSESAWVAFEAFPGGPIRPGVN